MVNKTWLLPEGIEELLPEQAAHMESMRRGLLDLFDTWGYDLVIPPMVEYLDSLLTGTGGDMDLHTFRLTDQMSGRMMGIRADMTPQVARIDNHRIKRDEPTRLCYMGSVLHTHPQTLGGSRSPMQMGAELYGHSGLDSDSEILELMLTCLKHLGVKELHLDLGHVGIFRSLCEQAGISDEVEAQLFEILQRKAHCELEPILEQHVPSAAQRAMFIALAGLHGGGEVMSEAAERLKDGGEAIQACLQQLQKLADIVGAIDGVSLHFDLAELRGYHYHTGLVFGVYAPGNSSALATGGRYDDIGQVFGRARPATGFSADLRALLAYADIQSPSRGIFAPAGQDATLRNKVAELRAAGERVVQGLAGQQGDAAAMGCERRLVQQNGEWVVQ